MQTRQIRKRERAPDLTKVAPRSVGETSELMRDIEERAQAEGLRREPTVLKIPESIRKLIDSKMDEAYAFYHDGSRAMTGKFIAGTFGTPLDITLTPTSREYGMETHWFGDDTDVTGIRSRAQLKTSDASTRTAQGALLQAANNDGIDAGVLNGAIIEAIGKSDSTAATITTMRGLLVNTEWNSKDTITDLKIAHIRTHTRNNATEGYVSGSGYGIYIENEAVGGNGQMLDAGIYFKGTNLSAGIKAFDYGIDFTGAEIDTAEIRFQNGETIDNLADGYLNLTAGAKIGDGGATNYVEIKADGEINLHGTARTHNHIRIAAPSWHPGVSAPAESDVGLFHTLAFDATSDDEAHFVLIIPWRMAAGDVIDVLIDWCYTGSQDNGTVCWAMEYLNLATGEAVAGAGTTIAGTSAGSHTTGTLVRTALNTGIVGAVAHDVLALHLYRDISEDTLAADAEMIEVHLEFLEDKLGKPT